MKIKIQVGLNKKNDLEYFLSKDVDEFYCGIDFIPSHLYYTKTFMTLEEVIAVLKKVKEKRKNFFLAVNEIQSNNFYETVSIIKYLIRNKIDGIIIRDIGLLKYLKEKKIKTYYILSSLSLCFNIEAIKFYKELGIQRIALPEQINYKEAKYLIKNPFGIETEIFLTSKEYCGVLNGFCYLKQFNNKCLCRIRFNLNDNQKIKLPIPSTIYHLRNIYRFIKTGSRIIKIGRHPDDFYGKIIFNEAEGIKNIFKVYPKITENEFIKKVFKLDKKITKVLEKCKEIYKKQ